MKTTRRCRLLLLGSTGSIGTQTLDVVAHLNRLCYQGDFDIEFEIAGLATGTNFDAMLQQARMFGVRELALANGASGLEVPDDMTLRTGPDAVERLVREVEADIVLGAVVGFAGLPATLAAVELGRDVALANKETLVAAGELVVTAAERTGARLLPVDSEHSAIWQCLASRSSGPVTPPSDTGADVRKIILTASGGALRTKSREEVYRATPEDALAHPTWNMGAKVTIDSASLTNKALELIEAHWLYGVGNDRLGVLVHPQSIVHSIVEFSDGSSIAQLGLPDMRTPIQYALTAPHRPAGRVSGPSWAEMDRLDFEPPDVQRFPALLLGKRVISDGGTSGAVFNAANERAVEAFLQRRIPFGRIGELTGQAMEEIGFSSIRDLADVIEADREARRCVDAALHA